MILNDLTIKLSRIISPYNESNLQSHSYDCTLHKIIKKSSPSAPNSWVDIDLSESPIVLRPGEFVLASTEETLVMPADIIGFVQGKSSIGRQGVQIENAGLIDPLFIGQITLELFNASPWPFPLAAGSLICQLYFSRVSPAEIKPYDKVGHYNGQKGPTIAYKN